MGENDQVNVTRKDDHEPLTQISLLPIDDLIEFRNNPFRMLDGFKMDGLIRSIKRVGIIEPILVRPHPSGEGYEIVDGHSRIEAAKRIGLKKVPSIIRNLSDFEAIDIRLSLCLMQDSDVRKRKKGRSVSGKDQHE